VAGSPWNGWPDAHGIRGQIAVVHADVATWAITAKHAKAAPFKRNDAMLDVLPVGVLVFPGNGIQENLADKARKLGIPVLKFERGACAPLTAWLTPDQMAAEAA